ncbi:ATP-binding protein [Marinobacter halodurans]|uniref:ATP-binding protein n=1 Tax=Marinobacter halodurans TaxID=2528979 RepID=A0ABY1ZL18_9GAMM|nr:ATP-binding protein [Marinobacter halodurans]TBW56198.1 ATP-binding protein [Marinobacter halodurans]
MSIDWQTTPAAIWRRHRNALRAVKQIDPVRLDQLLEVDRQKQQLVTNTERFLRGQPANNALLWGARGTGKSSLIKAILNTYFDQGLRIVEVDRDDLLYLPEIVDDLRDLDYRFIIFSDDLSFERGEGTYKALKSVMEGSIESPPENIKVYATSNRRHLMPEYMKDNQQAEVVDGELHPGEAIEEQVSLSDRFGLWLSFYPFNQEAYLHVVDALFPQVEDREELHRLAIRFALGKGGRSGRAAQHFYNAYSDYFG